MTIIPIFQRELLVALRRERVHSQRAYFGAFLLTIVLGTFATWYYWAGGRVSHLLMSEVAEWWAITVCRSWGPPFGLR